MTSGLDGRRAVCPSAGLDPTGCRHCEATSLKLMPASACKRGVEMLERNWGEYLLEEYRAGLTDRCRYGSSTLRRDGLPADEIPELSIGEADPAIDATELDLDRACVSTP